MSAPTVEGRPHRTAGRAAAAMRAFWTGISAVSIKELRSRMRGRRAFVVVTIYLLLLSAFAFGIYAYLRQQAALRETSVEGGSDGVVSAFFSGTNGLALSADIGHAIFSGLLLVETLLVLLLAPAFTTSAISLERERGTIDLLVTTPLSTLGMVIGKLFSALVYVYLLILASVPLMAVVFVFGGVGPDDVARAYLLLVAVAFGMGAIGLFISSLVRRTQTATVLTFIVVLALTMGSAAIHEFWTVISTSTSRTQTGFVPVVKPNRAPEALLWLNPFVGDLDLICTTAPGGYQRFTCDYVAAVTSTPFFSTPVSDVGDGGLWLRKGLEAVVPAARVNAPVPAAVVVADAVSEGSAGVAGPVFDDTRAGPDPVQQLATFGFPRDTFWPESAATFIVVGVVLTFLSAQLVAPTRRLRLPRPRRRAPAPAPAGAGAEVTPGTIDEVTS